MHSFVISSSLENYLEVILNLSNKKDIVRVTDIANEVGVTKASVAQALKELKKKELIHQERYGPVELTPKGKQHAKIITHRHEIMVTFLTKVLGLNPSKAHEEACLMEHVLSDQTIELITDFMSKHGYQVSFRESRVFSLTKTPLYFSKLNLLVNNSHLHKKM